MEHILIFIMFSLMASLIIGMPIVLLKLFTHNAAVYIVANYILSMPRNQFKEEKDYFEEMLLKEEDIKLKEIFTIGAFASIKPEHRKLLEKYDYPCILK